MTQQMTVTFLLFGLFLGSSSQFPPRTYFYVNTLMTWHEAQQYCREHYTDLATFESMDDIKGLTAPFPYSWAWVGLWDDPNSWKQKMGSGSNAWRWSTTGEPSKTSYQNWNTGDPDFYGAQEKCVAMDMDDKWLDIGCSTKYGFICYNVTEQNVKQYVYIATLETWSSAQTYCRTHYTDLAMIENEAENFAAERSKVFGDIAWIGLYRVPWTWSDGSPSLFRLWYLSSPKNNGGNRHCVLENPSHQWSEENCGVKKYFICHQVVKKTTVVRMTTVTDADLSDPTINAKVLQQLGALLTSQGWTDFKLQWKTSKKQKK